MILQALCGYYERLLHQQGSTVALHGYARAPVSSCIVIDNEGNVVSVRTLKRNEGKKTISSQIIVPEQPKRSGQKPEPAFLCENPNFLFGIYEKEDGASYRFEASAEKHNEILRDVDDIGARALLNFFSNRTRGRYDVYGVDMSPLDEGGNVIFELRGDDVYLHERPAIRRAWEQYLEKRTQGAEVSQCLVTGETLPIARLHGSIRGFGQDKPTLVGFNQPAFTSYQKEQGQNAPVSERAAFSYVTALNTLMTDKSHRVRLHGDTVIFWAERDAPVEECLASIFFSTENVLEEMALDEPSAKKIRGILYYLYNGIMPEDPDIDPGVRFYILGLTNNRTRLVIRFFHTDTFGCLLERMRQHYADMALAGSKNVSSVYRILLETAVRRDGENVSPNLESELMRSILNGTCYPYGLYQAMIRRIRAEGGQDPQKLKGYPINAVRIGIIKAYLNRIDRMNNREERITVALNLNEKDEAYLLGRLFAVMEKAQKDALGNVNASIVDKYLNSALATPQMVFPMLLTLSKKHSAKSGNMYNDRLIGQIVSDLSSNGFPVSLNAEQQGRFMIGYYHQNQALYTPKADSIKNDAPAEQAAK